MGFGLGFGYVVGRVNHTMAKTQNLDSELQSLREKYTREEQELINRYQVLSMLPDSGDYAPPSICHYKLYGSVGSITYRIQRYSSIAKGKNPDAQLLKKLLTQHEPVDLMLIRRSCVSIRPEPETYESNGEVVLLDPVTIRMKPSHYDTCNVVEWYGKVGEDLWKFSVEFPYYNVKIGMPKYRWHYYGGRESGEVSSVEFIGFEPVPRNARRIKWAGGSSKDPGEITVYWERGKGLTVDELVELFA